MPLYEYICKQDGTVLELIRPMSQADAPVADPEGKGRVFERAHSTFATGGAASGSNPAARSTSLPVGGGCCPCGKGAGACSRN